MIEPLGQGEVCVHEFQWQIWIIGGEQCFPLTICQVGGRTDGVLRYRASHDQAELPRGKADGLKYRRRNGWLGQAIYFCPACARETERHPQHTCGETTRLQRGLPWLDNDGVNLACALVGALLALLGYGAG